MSTTACKTLLTTLYPGTHGRDWKREDKKSSTGIIIRLFFHYEKGLVTVIDNGFQLQAKAGIASDFVMYQANHSPLCIIYIAHQYLPLNESVKIINKGMDYLDHLILLKHLSHYQGNYYYCSMNVADKVFRTLQSSGLHYDSQLIHSTDLEYHVAHGAFAKKQDFHPNVIRQKPLFHIPSIITDLQIFDDQKENWQPMLTTPTTPTI